MVLIDEIYNTIFKKKTYEEDFIFYCISVCISETKDMNVVELMGLLKAKMEDPEIDIEKELTKIKKKIKNRDIYEFDFEGVMYEESEYSEYSSSTSSTSGSLRNSIKSASESSEDTIYTSTSDTNDTIYSEIHYPKENVNLPENVWKFSSYSTINCDLKNKIFCFTGNLNHFGRDEVHNFCIRNNAFFNKHMTKSVDILVKAENNCGNYKLKLAKKWGTKIITEDTFYSMITENLFPDIPNFVPKSNLNDRDPVPVTENSNWKSINIGPLEPSTDPKSNVNLNDQKSGITGRDPLDKSTFPRSTPQRSVGTKKPVVKSVSPDSPPQIPKMKIESLLNSVNKELERIKDKYDYPIVNPWENRHNYPEGYIPLNQSVNNEVTDTYGPLGTKTQGKTTNLKTQIKEKAKEFDQRRIDKKQVLEKKKMLYNEMKLKDFEII